MCSTARPRVQRLFGPACRHDTRARHATEHHTANDTPLTSEDPPISRVAELPRSIVAFPAIRTSDENLLLRSLKVYETHRLDYAEAYLAASAERSGVKRIVSFDQSIDRVPTVTRIGPGIVSDTKQNIQAARRRPGCQIPYGLPTSNTP